LLTTTQRPEEAKLAAEKWSRWGDC